MTSTPTVRINSSTRVRDHLRDALLEGRIPPDTKLVISELCASLDVSLGSVREALSALAGEGLVVARAKRGFWSAALSLEELNDLTSARCEIESICLTFAIERGGLDWEGGILAAWHKLDSTPRIKKRGRGKPTLSDDWSAAHAQFHDSLVSACGNEFLLRTRDTLFERTERYRRLSVPIATAERDVRGEHKRIMDAALAHDARKAVASLREHLLRTASIVSEGGLESGLGVDAPNG